MSLLIDIGIILLVVVFVLQGMRRGIVKSVLSLFNIIISSIFAGVLSAPISNYIYDTFFSSAIYDRIYSSLADNDKYTAVTEFFSDLPDGLVNVLAFNGVSETSILSSISGTNESISEGILDIISPIFISVINVFVAIIIFFLVLIFFNLVINAVCNLIKIPILSSVNTLLGGAIGLVFALCVVWLLIVVISFSAEFVDASETYMLIDGINNSFFANILSGSNPFTWIFEN